MAYNSHGLKSYGLDSYGLTLRNTARESVASRCEKKAERKNARTVKMMGTPQTSATTTQSNVAYIVMACHGLYSHGLYSHGLYSHGLYSHGLYSYGTGDASQGTEEGVRQGVMGPTGCHNYISHNYIGHNYIGSWDPPGAITI